MDLDDLAAFSRIDSKNMLGEIEGLPDQLTVAWRLGFEQPLPDWQGIRQVVLAGMGGSAIGADLLAAYLASSCRVPVFVQRDYGLPVWANGPETLVIACSHSGNTEETLSCFEQAIQNGCRCLAVTRGGKLAELSRQASVPLWTFEHKGVPRAAAGFSFGLLLAAFVRLNLALDQATVYQDLVHAVEVMRRQQASLKPEVPAARNLAKRNAGQLVGRWVTVIGADVLAPVARRWKGQISELAKAWAQFEFLPEADHNTLAGIMNPEDLFARSMVVFLRAASYHPRNLLRIDLTRKLFMLEGINTDVFEAAGDTPLAHLWTTLHFGDYMAYYLAMAYGIDPTPVDIIEDLKAELHASN
jgi:glucose/mannose-6-phosphate isomerase